MGGNWLLLRHVEKTLENARQSRHCIRNVVNVVKSGVSGKLLP